MVRFVLILSVVLGGVAIGEGAPPIVNGKGATIKSLVGSGKLPASADYLIEVTSSGQPVDYALEVGAW